MTVVLLVIIVWLVGMVVACQVEDRWRGSELAALLLWPVSAPLAAVSRYIHRRARRRWNDASPEWRKAHTWDGPWFRPIRERAPSSLPSQETHDG